MSTWFLPSATNVPILPKLEPCTEKEIRKLVVSSSSVNCSLDVIPTQLLTFYRDALATPITRLVNLSLSEGLFPDTCSSKLATVLPRSEHAILIKIWNFKLSSNFEPWFYFKILEKVILARLTKHLEFLPTLSRFQSACRKFHSLKQPFSAFKII